MNILCILEYIDENIAAYTSWITITMLMAIRVICGWKGGALSAAAFRDIALSYFAYWQDEIRFTWGKFVLELGPF